MIPAHNEEATVATIVGQALQAAQPGDRVLVVDSGSTDDTARRAREAGAEVLDGPLGKGAAMQLAVSTVDHEWTCFLDSDVVTSERNVPALLRETAAGGTADQVVGDFEYDHPGTILASTFTIYEPLTSRFFPEVGYHGAHALSGFRAVRTRYLRDVELPPDFGVETFLNISLALSGGRADVCHLGVIGSRYRFHGGSMATEIGTRILDLAEAHGRLDPADRPEWDQWLAAGVAAIAPNTADQGRSAILSRLFSTVRRPMPTGGTQTPAHSTSR
ncbi:glycosyltransferase [Streptomyces griseus]|uniref:glycosyltransferase family 2 protein n=1 Tax=Streptomyces griseus TaxID=1911 RepID=UPI0022773E1F|nr:glycosyltransferase [Streptomyces griseus]